EDERKTGRALLDILERLSIGARRVGIVDPLRDGPWRGRLSAHGEGPRVVNPKAERIDADAVIRMRDKRILEGGAAQGFVRKLSPPLHTEPGEARLSEKVTDLHCSSYSAFPAFRRPPRIRCQSHRSVSRQSAKKK